MIDRAMEAVRWMIDLGGAVVAILLALSIIALAMFLFKLWQHATMGVGRHGGLSRALRAWDEGDAATAARLFEASPSYLAPVLRAGIDAVSGEADRNAVAARLSSEAGARIARIEGGFRLLDLIAQLAPLLGLFGTVQGMIQAFQAMQAAGSAVDPSILAGGIWVALLTTIVGLAVAMPVTLGLTWLEARTARERVMADLALQTLVTPGLWSQARPGRSERDRGHARDAA